MKTCEDCKCFPACRANAKKDSLRSPRKNDRADRCGNFIEKPVMPGPHPDPFLNGPTLEEDCLP